MEALIAVLLLGLVVVGLLGGYAAVIGAGETDRAAAANTAVTRRAASELSAAAYVTCGSVAAYDSVLQTAYTPPTGSTAHVTAVDVWNLGTTPPTFGASCNPATAARTSGGDSGLQRVTFATTSVRGKHTVRATRTILKRFDGSYPPPVASPAPGGHTCTISPGGGSSQVDSNWVDQFHGGTVHAGDNEMDILYLNGTRRFSYLKFKVDASSVCDEGGTLGAGHTILTARLHLYTFNIGGLPACGANSCWHALERVRAAWNPSTLTWNNQPCPNGGAVNLPSCRADGAKGVEFEHGTGALNWSARYQDIEAPQLLQDVKDFYANSAVNFGWVIKEACDGGAGPYNHACGDISPGFQFRTKTASGTQAPRLEVVYQ